MNLSTLIVLIAVLAAVSAIVLHMAKNRKNGRSSCACGNRDGNCTCKSKI